MISYGLPYEAIDMTTNINNNIQAHVVSSRDYVTPLALLVNMKSVAQVNDS